MTSPAARVIIANRRDHGWWWRLPLCAVLWLAIAAPIVVMLLAAAWLRSAAADLPDVPDLASWRDRAPRTSYVVAADGTRLAELPFEDGKAVGHRTFVTLDRIPRHVIEAVLAAEDVRFFDHRGVDYQAIVRAAWANYRAERVVEGASTITQQLARNLLPDEIGNERSARRKAREVLMARAIERRWSKRDVLESYLSLVYFGQGAYGLAAAARAYFDRSVDQLDVAQAALLAGLIQAPSRLDPYRHPEAARARRDEVLARMVRAHLIDEATRATAVASGVVLQRPHPSYGTRVPWFTEQARLAMVAAFPDQLRRGGLVIESAALPALGTQLQADAVSHADRWGGAQVGALVWDHRSGYIQALIGGRAWNPDRFDRVIQSCRQPGSAWKPILYGAALERGAITPGTALRDAPVAEYDAATNVHWKPKSGGRFRGVVLAQDAIAASLNAPAIDVFDRVGPGFVIELARRLGISTAISPLRPMALGASCVRPLELARAYAVIARRGQAIGPRLVVRARRGDQSLFDAAVADDPYLDPARRFDRMAALAGTKSEQLLDERVAFQLQDMMVAVTSRGTASAAGALGRSTAGKTGTTNDNTDAWFVGFTDRVLALAWVGFDDPKHKLGPDGDGAHAALPLWMKAITNSEGMRHSDTLPGHPPAGMVRAAIDRESGLLAPAGVGGLSLWFRDGTAPVEVAGQPGTSSSDFGTSTREF